MCFGYQKPLRCSGQHRPCFVMILSSNWCRRQQPVFLTVGSSVMLSHWSPQDLISLFLCLTLFLGSVSASIWTWLMGFLPAPCQQWGSQSGAGSIPAHWGLTGAPLPLLLPRNRVWPRGWLAELEGREFCLLCAYMHGFSHEGLCVWVCGANNILPFSLELSWQPVLGSWKDHLLGWGIFMVISAPCTTC